MGANSGKQQIAEVGPRPETYQASHVPWRLHAKSIYQSRKAHVAGCKELRSCLVAMSCRRTDKW